MKTIPYEFEGNVENEWSKENGCSRTRTEDFRITTINVENVTKKPKML